VWVLRRQERRDLGQKLSAALVAGGIRRDDHVELRRQEFSLQFEFLAAVLVDFEPSIHVEGSKTHGHAPALRLERNVREVAHLDRSRRRAMMNQ
jgi:hypothetical protein